MLRQMALVVAITTIAMLAMPFCHQHRMNVGVFIGGMLTFACVPLVAGILQQQAYRSVAVFAIALLVFCPAVYAITDHLAVEFEKLRDGYFLATGSTTLFAFATWFRIARKAQKWNRVIFPMFGIASSVFGIAVLLWMVLYFE